MTTATPIQTRIAYALRDDRSPDGAVIEFLSHGIDGHRQACELSGQSGAIYDSEIVVLQSSERGAAGDAAVTLDDFGGRSDALGG
jgi:hypothetical protein